MLRLCGFHIRCDLRLLRAGRSSRQLIRPQRVSDALREARNIIGRSPGKGSTRFRCRLLHAEWHLARLLSTEASKEIVVQGPFVPAAGRAGTSGLFSKLTREPVQYLQTHYERN